MSEPELTRLAEYRRTVPKLFHDRFVARFITSVEAAQLGQTIRPVGRFVVVTDADRNGIALNEKNGTVTFVKQNQPAEPGYLFELDLKTANCFFALEWEKRINLEMRCDWGVVKSREEALARLHQPASKRRYLPDTPGYWARLHLENDPVATPQPAKPMTKGRLVMTDDIFESFDDIKPAIFVLDPSLRSEG